MQAMLYNLFSYNAALSFPFHLPSTSSERRSLLSFDFLQAFKSHGRRWLRCGIDRVPKKDVGVYPWNVIVVFSVDECNVVLALAAIYLYAV